jgi:hypothetical protein
VNRTVQAGTKRDDICMTMRLAAEFSVGPFACSDAALFGYAPGYPDVSDR